MYNRKQRLRNKRCALKSRNVKETLPKHHRIKRATQRIPTKATENIGNQDPWDVFLGHGGYEMPPKVRFTKDEVIQAALCILRNSGMAGLTARALGQALGSSAKPVFGLFRNMEEVQSEVLAAAHEVYQTYLRSAMEQTVYPPYKAGGMAYIQFATDERELFKLLFMRDRTPMEQKEQPSDREQLRPLLQLLMQNLGIDEDTAYLCHMEMWIFVHGVAVMKATSFLDWDTEFISKALTNAYKSLQFRYLEDKFHGAGDSDRRTM